MFYFSILNLQNYQSMNIICKVGYICIILLIIPIYTFGQQDTIYNNKKQINKYDELLHNREIGKLQFELLSVQNNAQEQKVYKYLFIAISGFLILTSFLVFYTFYLKIKRNQELFQLQEREINLRETQINQLSVILNSTTAPMLITSSEGKIKWMNAAFEEYYGYKLEVLQQNNKDNFISDILNEDEKRYVDECYKSKKGVSYKVNAGDGKHFEFQRNISVILNKDDTISGLSVVDNIIK